MLQLNTYLNQVSNLDHATNMILQKNTHFNEVTNLDHTINTLILILQ